MSQAAEKVRLRKELEKYYPFAQGLTRKDLANGKWFTDFLERTLAGFSTLPAPAEIRARFPDEKTPDELADAVVRAAIHEAISATDAYEENLSGTEIRNLKEKRPSRPDDRLTGDAIALVAELAYTLLIDVKMVFDMAAAYGKQLNAGQMDAFYEMFAHALGAFDVEEAKASGNFGARIGAKIFDRAIAQTLGSDLGEAQRKGFYCYFAKALSKEAKKLIPSLPEWVDVRKEELTGPMAAVEDAGGYET